MKSLLPFLLLPTLVFASIPTVTHPPLPQKELVGTIQKNHSGGRWYMAADGHAIFCYGPTMLIRDAEGDFSKVATFCRDGRAIVKLKE